MGIAPNKIYNSPILKKGLAFASDNSALFGAGVSLALSTAVRPVAIALTPKTEDENKKYAITKSLASSLVGFSIMALVTTPVSKAVKLINQNPKAYLRESTINFLQNGEKTLQASKKYNFATQLFKLGLGFLVAAPKSILTSKLISPMMDKFFSKKEEKKQDETVKEAKPENAQKISFKANFYDKYVDKIAKKIGDTIDTKTIQNMSEKFYKTNFEQHMMNATDILTTGVFVVKTMSDKKIEDKRKKVLSINSVLSTGMSVLGGLGLNKMLEKPIENFTKGFIEANKNSPNLAKYLEGIRVAKSTLILGGIYYILIPVISTFLAERVEKKLDETLKN